MHRHPPSSTLFPYTTLFRSRLPISMRRGRCGDFTCEAGITFASDSSSTPLRSISVSYSEVCSKWAPRGGCRGAKRSEEHTSELQSRFDLVCRLLLEKKKIVPILHNHVLHANSSGNVLSKPHDRWFAYCRLRCMWIVCAMAQFYVLAGMTFVWYYRRC